MHVHFVGIGGSGVSGLSLMARSKGYEVSGCDLNESPYFLMVEKEGVKCIKGHSPDHLENVDIVVRSSAVPMTCPEIVKAQEKGLEVLTRGQFLAKLVEDQTVIGISGSHGKTSTAWIIYHVLRAAGFSPSVYTGGKCAGRSNITDGELQIIELDESDGSIFEFSPDILLINNLEFEHPDHYPSAAEMLSRFERYLLNNRPEILVVGRGYDLSDSLYSMFTPCSFPTVDEIKSGKSFQNVESYDFYLRDNKWYFLSGSNEVFIGARKEPTHVLQNRSASLMICEAYLNSIGKELPEFDESLWEGLPTVDRRFQVVGKYKGISLVDDYAHHPSEIEALAEQAEFEFNSFGMIFQPHRFSRFNAFYKNFVEVLSKVEPLVILPVYSAGEKKSGMDSKMLFEDIKRTTGNEVYYFETIEDSVEFFKENAQKLHVSALVTVGAGDVNKINSLLREK